MKSKFTLIFLVALLSSGIYVGAKTLDFQNNHLVKAVNNDYARYQNYLTVEEHEQIFEKRIELTYKYLSNYNLLTSEEKKQAELDYNNELQTFIIELSSGYVNYFECEDGFSNRVFTRLNDEDHEQVILKRVELTFKYLSSYSSLTQDEKEEAKLQYRTEFHNYIQNLINNNYESCQGFGRKGRMYRR